MKRILLFTSLLFVFFCHAAMAGVTTVNGGYRVDYRVDIPAGTSNGNDINDVLMLEWNASGGFSAEFGGPIAGRGSTTLSHVIGFEPSSSLVIGWGAAVPGVGDEKDHLFMLANSGFTREVTGKKWSEAFPGTGEVPRIGHNDMIGLLRDAASGDKTALTSIIDWVGREAQTAAFDPHQSFRVIEWSGAHPIDVVRSVPAMSQLGQLALLLALAFLGMTAIRSRMVG